jgi:3-oxoacyl-[acyl-carrier protein] reductase
VAPSSVGGVSASAVPGNDIQAPNSGASRLKGVPSVGRLNGKVALITGGASGIGEATVVAFLREDAQVIAADLQADRLDALLAEHAGSGRLATIVADISTPDGARSAAAEASEKFGPINVLVNVAGLHDAGISTLDTSDEQWDKTFAVNVGAQFWLAKALVPAMVSSGGGAIVTISSAAGLVGGGGGPAYTASKHAAVGLTKALAVEFGPQGVRANTIAPGVTQTPMLDALPDEVKGGFGAVAESLAARRLGTPPEIAEAVVFLASDEASFVYGATLSVDGGFTTV